MSTDFLHIVSILKLCDIEAQTDADNDFHIHQKILAYPNPDGTIRWMWNAESKQPLFLKFYGVIGWKSKVFAMIVKLSFLFRLQKLLAKKSFNIYMNVENYEKYKSIFGDEWAVFTGTSGKLRKAVFTMKNADGNFFLKVPLTEAAKKIVQLEFENLIKLNKFHFKNTVTPLGKMKGESLLQNDLSSLCNTRSAIFSNAHFLSMKDVMSATQQKKSIGSTHFWQTIESNFTIIQSANKPEKIALWDELTQNLITLKNSINTSSEINTSLAHADLTAWNCFADKEKLYIYDWELAMEDAPASYDLFHFHIQGNCLLGNQSFEIIQDKLNQTFATDEVKNFISEFKIDKELHLQLYLLYHVSSSLCWYAEQKDLHMQVQWLTALWNKYLTIK